jgi:hypothetical protein
MNQCHNCGTYVPVEKAFCPNCSEPIEPEEAPNRAATSSSDMLSTMRDDPENYRELLSTLRKKQDPPAGAPAPGVSAAPADYDGAGNAGADKARWAASVAGYTASQVAPERPLPAKSGKRTLVLIIGAISFLILLFVILLVFKLV